MTLLRSMRSRLPWVHRQLTGVNQNANQIGTRISTLIRLSLRTNYWKDQAT